MKTALVRTFVYVWASPTTAVGLLALALTLGSGGWVTLQRGALECYGGFATWFLTRKYVSASAMTLGHVILGQCPLSLAACRNHEHIHVQQVEKWGGFFLPVYLLSSLIAYWKGEHYYYDNIFEIDARRQCGEREFRRDNL